MPENAWMLVLPCSLLIFFGMLWAFVDVRSAFERAPDAAEAAEEAEE